jgi:nascent polypeptide-associated complex subunit alpha
MIPKINPRQLEKAMRMMGVSQEEIEATEVIIKCPDKEIIILNPSVMKVKGMGPENFQIAGEVHERELSTETEITEEDIQTVAQQANVNHEKAEEALKEAKGDIAEAILNLTKTE